MIARCLALAAVSLNFAMPAQAADRCKTLPGDQTPAVVKAARDLFAAAQADDAAAFRAGTTADFYAYDGGRRLDGMALFEMIKAAHAAGRRFEWTVQEPRVTVTCGTAFLAYVNRGAVGDTKAMQPMTWLESDYLRFEDRRWRIAFLHSTRQAPTP
jgi:hypothetical protein